MGGYKFDAGIIVKKLNPPPLKKMKWSSTFKKIITQKIFVGEKNVT